MEKQFEKACKSLKITEEPIIIDSPELQAGQEWQTHHIVEEVQRYLRSKEGEGEIEIIFTYDKGGVTGNANNKKVREACSELQQQNQYLVDVMHLTTAECGMRWMGIFSM